MTYRGPIKLEVLKSCKATARQRNFYLFTEILKGLNNLPANPHRMLGDNSSGLLLLNSTALKKIISVNDLMLLLA